jgi:hypothetical protein
MVNLDEHKMDGVEDYAIDMEKTKEDTVYMTGKTIKPEVVIHCEVRILLHILKAENENPQHPQSIQWVHGETGSSCSGFDYTNRHFWRPSLH